MSRISGLVMGRWIFISFFELRIAVFLFNTALNYLPLTRGDMIVIIRDEKYSERLLAAFLKPMKVIAISDLAQRLHCSYD